MKNTKRPWFILFLLSIFATLVASAQVTVTNLQPEHITAADQQIADAVSKFSYWKTMIVPLTLILVAAIKKWVGFIPNKYLPWTGPVIGGLLDLLASKFGFWTGDVGAGAAMGGLATWAHQAMFVQPASENTDDPAGDDEGATRKLPLWLLIGALSFGVVAPVAFTGCHTPTTQKKAVNTLQTIHESVDFVFNGYLDLIVQKVIATNSLPRVSREYGNFQQVYNAAVIVVVGNTNATAPPSVLNAATSFTTTVTEAKKGNF